MSGNIRADILLDKPLRFTAEGKMAADGLVIPLKGTAPVEIDRLSVGADGGRFSLDSCNLKWGDDRLSLRGNLISSKGGILVDMDASTSVIDVGRLEEKLKNAFKKKEERKENPVPVLPLIGTVRLKADKLRYGKIIVAPFGVEIFLGGQEVSVGVTDAGFCGVSVPGRLNVSGGEISLDFWPAAENSSLESTLFCLSHAFDLDDYATGTFVLSGTITGKGREKDLIPSIRGNIELTARDGRIYYIPSVLKILAFLEVRELAKGYSDVWKKGLAYDKVVVKSRLRYDRIDIDEGTLDGPYMKMASQGYINPVKKKLDVKVLVSPMRTIDRIVEKIPVIGYILGGTLFSIPVRVSGDLENPKVRPILLSANSGLFGMMKRTLELPFKILAPSVLEKKK